MGVTCHTELGEIGWQGAQSLSWRDLMDPSELLVQEDSGVDSTKTLEPDRAGFKC